MLATSWEIEANVNSILQTMNLKFREAKKLAMVTYLVSDKAEAVRPPALLAFTLVMVSVGLGAWWIASIICLQLGLATQSLDPVLNENARPLVQKAGGKVPLKILNRKILPLFRSQSLDLSWCF